MTSHALDQPPFEGPEKKLSVSFRPHPSHRSASLRSIPRHQIDLILQSASCSVLSVCHNAHFDAYLLSESSLFVASHLFVIKTCGTTTLLGALPHIFQLATALHLVPVSLSFSRVRYSFPQAQMFPHNCFENEVTFIDDALQACNFTFEKLVHIRSNWHLYHASFPCAEYERDDEHRTTLDIYMFDLDEQSMSNFRYDQRPHVIGIDNLHGVTENSGVSRLVHDCDVVDAFNFAPCGYSMNALNSRTYSTVHVTPEPDASYVSFEISGDLHSVSLLVAKVVRLFKPKSFTMSLLGHVLDEHEQCGNVAKLLQADFTCTWPLSRVESGDVHASVCSFEARHYGMRSTSDQIGERADSVAMQVGTRFGAVAVDEGVCGVQLAREVLAKSMGAGAGGATLMVDLSGVEREMRRARAAVGLDVELRYLVKMNAARGMLAVLDEMGALFEASDEMDLMALESVKVRREKIVLVSTVVCEEAVARVGAVAVFGVGKTVEMAARHGVCLEICVVDGIVSQVDAVLKEVVSWGARVSGVAFYGGFDGEVVRSVLERVCEAVGDVKGLRVVVGEAGDGARRAWADPVWDVIAEARAEGKHVQTVATVGARLGREAVSVRLEVMGRKRREEGGMLYYLSDGAYGVLNGAMMGDKVGRVSGGGRGEMTKAVLFGPTCDGLDVVWRGEMREMEVGEVVVVQGVADMGGATAFNGMGARVRTCYVVRK
eukprot:TRINITY_DN78103_c0_g1_i1.p1 TRINITY_DN78103_c0_g1~~TRINITY_DN78103_c0_g1_i1.p1  ORF type:complete len:715 (+),score=121.83 TRINITY_DN78103_c0_g1_i1:370-2514(+)